MPTGFRPPLRVPRCGAAAGLERPCEAWVGADPDPARAGAIWFLPPHGDRLAVPWVASLRRRRCGRAVPTRRGSRTDVPDREGGTMVRQADWYFDFISPYPYLQLARFDRLPADLDVRPVPVLFAGLLGHWATWGRPRSRRRGARPTATATGWPRGAGLRSRRRQATRSSRFPSCGSRSPSTAAWTRCARSTPTCGARGATRRTRTGYAPSRHRWGCTTRTPVSPTRRSSNASGRIRIERSPKACSAYRASSSTARCSGATTRRTC